MKHALAASAIALAIATAGPIQAEQTTGQKLSQQECDALWKAANPSNVEKLPEAAASAYISDIKAANPDGDTTIEKDEFSKACANGLVKAAAAGGKQPAAGETSDRTPEAKTETPPEQKDSAGGATSDRTPEKK